ncbi:interferon induced protein 44c2 [Silurus meridionalis]|uniref:interferon induced protein 44c2 n=1 Tax=Silurus meridionalis TaxID=175797 RepID=UPI001EECB99E|nr:interferon induced protein 44c2 [Silurus meridionalis]XP_046707540.1 interferon induced protein 44c2 [Silurus meridionalis]
MMSVINSRLSKQQEMKLCSLLCNAKLSLLYKASVHGFSSSTFHQKCDVQGPTVTVAYNNSGYVFGAYTSKDYAQTGQNIADDKAFLFSFSEHEVDEAPLRVVSTEPQRALVDGNTGPNYVSMVFLYNNTATVYSNPGTYRFNPVEMHGNDLQLSECEVYRVEGFGSLMEEPWRNIEWSLEKRKSLIDMISRWTPSVSSVQRARVLLVGAVGSGKSSFFNSVNSIFKGHVSCRANTGTAGTSLTTQFRVYSMKAGSKMLPIVLCDSMGLEEGLNAGLDIDDFTNILKGHIQDKYQFNPSMPLQSESPYFCKAPSLKQKIHTVVYVMDACRIKLLSDKMIEKMTAFRKVNQMGIPQMVLLTKVDEACRSVGEDLKHIYQSHYIYKMVQEVSVRLGVSLSTVVPVKNYIKELELDPCTDIVLLSAVLQMIRTAEAYFDDFSCDEDYSPEEQMS